MSCSQFDTNHVGDRAHIFQVVLWSDESTIKLFLYTHSVVKNYHCSIMMWNYLSVQQELTGIVIGAVKGPILEYKLLQAANN